MTSVNDVLIPAVRSILRLTTTEAFLTQFAFFLAYGVVALGVMVAGCPLMPVAAALRRVLSQAFDSIGTVIVPILAAETLLRGGVVDGGVQTDAKVAASLGRIDIAYAVVAALVRQRRRRHDRLGEGGLARALGGAGRR